MFHNFWHQYRWTTDNNRLTHIFSARFYRYSRVTLCCVSLLSTIENGFIEHIKHHRRIKINPDSLSLFLCKKEGEWDEWKALVFTCSLIIFVAISRHYRFAYILWFSIPYQNYLIQNFRKSYIYTRCAPIIIRRSLSLELDFGKSGELTHVSWNTQCQWFERKLMPPTCVYQHTLSSPPLSRSPPFSRTVFYILICFHRQEQQANERVREIGWENRSQQFIRPS